jgi:hypothetical protein
MEVCARCHLNRTSANYDNPGYGKQMRPVIRQPFKARTTEELMALLSAVATAILAVIIIATLYFGREIFVPIALAILLSFVLAPVVGILQRIRVPRGLAVVSVATPKSIQLVMKKSLARSWKHLANESLENQKPTIPRGPKFWALSKSEWAAIDDLFQTPPRAILRRR